MRGLTPLPLRSRPAATCEGGPWRFCAPQGTACFKARYETSIWCSGRFGVYVVSFCVLSASHFRVHGYSRLIYGLQDGTSPASSTMTPPLFIVQKKLVAPGPGLEPVLVLEATSPRRGKGGHNLPHLIRAVPYAQRNNKGVIPTHLH
jgi:hypothetical protein